MPTAPRARSRHRQQVACRRQTAAQRGYGGTWAEYSRAYRNEVEHAVCELCKRRSSECVDHIVPVDGPDDPLFWEPPNHWALCWECHSWKTAAFDGGYGHAMAGGRDPVVRRAQVVERYGKM